MIGGFRKNSKRGNFRKKVVTEEEEEEEEEGKDEEAKDEKDTNDGTAIPITEAAVTRIASVSNPVINRSSKKTSLSFGDELEKEDEFVLKRSKASLTLNEQLKREKKIKKQKNIVINGPSVVKTVEADEKSNSEGFMLRQTEIPFSSTNEEVLDIEENDSNKVRNSDNFAANHHFSMRRKSKNPGAIPDAATIYAMKKQREQARHCSGGLPAYIPLDSNKHTGRFQTESSRLVREDDSSDEERIEMRGTTKKSNPALERRKQVKKALEEIEENEDTMSKKEEDDEILAWEDEQMKKGSKIPTNLQKKYGPVPPDPNTDTVASSVTAVNNPYATAGLVSNTFSGFYQHPAAGIPASTEQKVVTVEMVQEKLQEQLETKKQLFRLHKLQCEKTKFDLDLSQENIVSLERKTEDISDRFTFYQDIRGFIKDLLECLGEKATKINGLEDSMHEILKKQALKVTTRRSNDVKDEVDEFSGRNNTESDRIAHLKSRRIAERESRRNQRRENRKRTPNMVHHEGLSSDDEMVSSDVLRFEAEKDKLIKDSENIFSEVVEDFSSIREIINRFEQWKFAFSESYREAYLGLCLPKLFSPFVKLQLLNWNPLVVESQDFEDFDWFKLLALYGYHEGDIDSDDTDINLVPNIVEKALVPKLTILLRDVWDPLSSKQTKLITFILQRLLDDYPTITKESKLTSTLVETVISRLTHSVENEIYIPLFARETLETNSSPSLAFLERQFWKGVKLLQNLLEWNWLLSRKKIIELGIDAILNRYLIIALQQFMEPMSTFDKAKFVINIFPKDWFEKSEHIMMGMKSFARFLSGLAATCHEIYLGNNLSIEQMKMKITIKKVISLLMHIQFLDEAKVVSSTYGFRKETDSPT